MSVGGQLCPPGALHPAIHLMRPTLTLTLSQVAQIQVFLDFYRSEGLPRAGYFIPAHVGDGGGVGWGCSAAVVVAVVVAGGVPNLTKK